MLFRSQQSQWSNSPGFAVCVRQLKRIKPLTLLYSVQLGVLSPFPCHLWSKYSTSLPFLASPGALSMAIARLKRVLKSTLAGFRFKNLKNGCSSPRSPRELIKDLYSILQNLRICCFCFFGELDCFRFCSTLTALPLLLRLR